MSPTSRRLCILLIATGLVALLIAFARTAEDAPATSDTAVIESYTLMASHGQLLVGAYSRFQWHHPGPLYFYLLAPIYVLGGETTVALGAGAVLISLASLAVVLVLLFRRAPLSALTMGGTLSLFAWRGAEALASPWNPHVAVLPLVALIVASADVLAGRATTLPLVALLASLTGQAHIALMPVSIGLGAIAVAGAVVGAVRGPETGRWRRAMGFTTIVLALAWALPFYEQLTAVPRGNITELMQFFLHRQVPVQPLSVAVSAWSDMMVGVLRPDFYVAHGWPFVESPVRWAEWGALAISASLAAITVLSFHRGDRFGAALAGALLFSGVTGLWSTTRIEEKIFDHDVFWIAGVGVASAGVVLHAALRPLVRATGRAIARVSLAGCIIAAVVAGGAAVRELDAQVERSRTPSDEARTARLLASDLAGYMDRTGASRPLVKIDQDAWGVVAGAILDLQKRGRFVAVEPDWVVMFTPRFAPTGHEARVIAVTMPAEHARLAAAGWPLISSHEPIYAHAAPVSE